MSDDMLTRFDELVSLADSVMIGLVASSDEGVGACLVGFHCQCSIEPRRYAVWISKANHTFRIASRATHLAVHWLRDDQRALAIALGTVSYDDDDQKIERLAFTTDPSTGASLLADSADYFVGRIVGRHDDGDHVCFVLDIAVASSPSAHGRLRFAHVADLSAGHEAEDPEQVVV